jgi:stalled ribosome alternative rescue factor ArfA
MSEKMKKQVMKNTQVLDKIVKSKLHELRQEKRKKGWFYMSSTHKV